MDIGQWSRSRRLSIVLTHISTDLPHLGLVYGTGREGEYHVTCDAPDGEVSGLHLDYRIRSQVTISEEKLVANPFSFLHKSEDGGLPSTCGPDIYIQIACHLYRIAIDEVGPLHQYVADQGDAFKKIAKRNRDAARKIRPMLLSGNQG